MNIKESLIIGFKTKGLRFYGRSSRAEFWYFYLSTCFLIAISFKLNIIPVVGSLLQALVIIAIVACQYTATIRRLHDLNKSGKIVALPYIFTLAYFVTMGPINALQPELAPKVLDGLVTLATLSYLYILFLCTRIGTKGNNNYGTDPLDKSQKSQDFINPDHMIAPEYLGDPWRKFKAKVAREKAQGTKAPEMVSVPTPTTETKAESKYRSHKDRKKK